MTIVKNSSASKIEINIDGPDGNAHALMGYALNYGKQLSYSQEQLSTMIADMKSSDYEHLLEVFDKHFGMNIDLIRKDYEGEDDEQS